MAPSHASRGGLRDLGVFSVAEPAGHWFPVAPPVTQLGFSRGFSRRPFPAVCRGFILPRRAPSSEFLRRFSRPSFCRALLPWFVPSSRSHRKRPLSTRRPTSPRAICARLRSRRFVPSFAAHCCLRQCGVVSLTDQPLRQSESVAEPCDLIEQAEAHRRRATRTFGACGPPRCQAGGCGAGARRSTARHQG
jgi:hypothetical protein